MSSSSLFLFVVLFPGLPKESFLPLSSYAFGTSHLYYNYYGLTSHLSHVLWQLLTLFPTKTRLTVTHLVSLIHTCLLSA